MSELFPKWNPARVPPKLQITAFDRLQLAARITAGILAGRHATYMEDPVKYGFKIVDELLEEANQ